MIALHRRHPTLSPELKIIPKIVLAAAVGISAALLPTPALIDAGLGAIAFVAVLAALRAIPPELYHALRGRDPEGVDH
jgi:hypothetical protein